MREQNIYDKLREKEEGSTSQKKEDETIESFYPRLEDSKIFVFYHR